jgi:hypothetical protein
LPSCWWAWVAAWACKRLAAFARPKLMPSEKFNPF